MRLALVRQRYNPFGGAERIVERALPALARAGIEVTLIARQAGGWGGGAQRVLTVDPFYIGSLWRDASFARAARRAWQEGGFDLVQSHERIPGCSVYRAGDGVHRHWLAIRRAAARPGERLALALDPYHRYVCAAERAMFADSRLRAVICNSYMVRDEIRDCFGVAPERLHVVYNGVDLEHFHPRERARLREPTRAQLGLRDDDVLFVFVGSGFWRKGLDAALAALARSGRADFALAVAGRDRKAARFARLADELGVAARVRFLGPCADVRPLYAAADCFILPTRYDPFPNAALEALAMGVPAIVGARSGAAEILAPARTGWICDPADPQGLADLMREAAHAARDMQAAARAQAENFGIERMTAKLVSLYGALA
ncbi:MAG: glycosyltransferase family 4 protein [Burkholderiales bacterium]|nr:glycosyltransferase family 4 protein [Burkholderiales bacterium]